MQLTMLKNKNRYFWLLLALLTLAPVVNIYAEGSRTLYPDGVTGRRAYLSTRSSTPASWPFPNNGTHYVYAKPGEKIAMASSAQGFGANNNARWNNRERIELYGPNGNKITITTYTGSNANNATYYGNISDRTAEKAGPRFVSGVASGDKYEAVYHTVTVEGIYRVQFFSVGDGTSGNSGSANANWTQPSTSYIAAWDVSVINSTNNGYLDGRVYANVLNMAVESSNTDGFRGIIYALTKDGYIYKVNNNGNNGIWFTFFVNNNGFVNPASSPNFNERTPLYKSLNNTTNISASVHNPNSADVGSHITHKLFYNDPRTNLPEQTNPNITFQGAVPGGSTWLLNKPIVPDVSTPELIGADGIPGQVSSKGGIIKFNADVQGNYRIEISSDVLEGYPPTFTKRVLIGQAKVGENRVVWDGKDGTPENLGGPQPLPSGSHPVKVTVQLQGAEVHFPFFDMEMNINGTIIELLNAPDGTTDADRNRVYWDDSDITIGSGNNSGAASSPRNNTHLEDRFDPTRPAGYNGDGNGLDSRLNGHKWGTYNNMTNNSGFGNEKSIDTWAFITGEKKESQNQVNVKAADLEVVPVKTREPGTTIDKNDFNIDDVVEYEVVVKNNGPDGVTNSRFTFRLPPGFEPVDGFVPTFTSSCGSQDIPVQYDPVAHAYWSELSLPDQCEVTYVFRTTITENSDPDNLDAVAGILRPNDVTDPNAINRSDPENEMYEPSGGRAWDELWKYPAEWPDDDDVDNYYIPPFSAEYECANRDPLVTEECNNVKNKPVGLLRVSDLAMQKTVKNRPAIISVDDEIEFELTVTNNGPHAGAGIVVTDEVPAGFTILATTISNGGTIVSGTNTIKWTFDPDYRLANGDSFTLSFKVTVNSSGPYLNTATVTGEGEDPDPDNNTDTESASPQNNYWIGGKVGAPNDWDQDENWTGGYVPQPGEDIEFATVDNNGDYDPAIPNSGPAKKDLYLGDGDGTTSRIIGDLINDSDKDLWITTGDQLTIKGEVKDGNPDAGTIVVKTTPTDPTGTLIFEDPSKNGSVGATVEFYNQAYDCQTCGFYTRSWQYFGAPVNGSDFPFQSPVSELVNRWEEPVDGNKWVSVTSGNLIPFRGYQITNTGTTEPDHIYDFAGTLYVGDKDVALTRTTTPVVVNYAGANLVANSYTAAIPIKSAAMTFTNAAATVYLFNTGTRDEWRKLNGTAINQQGYRVGQYLAVPVNLGGTLHFPDRIPSMHSFMVLVDEAETTGNVSIKYDQLTKNTKVALGDGSTEIVTRSADSKGTSSSIPSLVMDVIGEESADRVWIFTKEGTTRGFDNGWDGRKMSESGIAQLYVADDEGKDLFQVATVPGLNDLSLGFVADVDGKYTLEFALSDHWTTEEIYLNDLAIGTRTRVKNGGSYTFEAKKGGSGTRFSLSSSGGIPTHDEAAKITVTATDDGKIAINNKSDNNCSVFISNTAGKLLQRLEVEAGNEQVVEDISGGTYVVRLQNAVVNDARKITIE
jgi:uncharacterized repeat protein (TIGR01451 family)